MQNAESPLVGSLNSTSLHSTRTQRLFNARHIIVFLNTITLVITFTLQLLYYTITLGTAERKLGFRMKQSHLKA